MKELEELGFQHREIPEGTKERIWARILQSLKEAVPAEEPRCEHGAGIGYCHERGCSHADA